MMIIEIILAALGCWLLAGTAAMIAQRRQNKPGEPLTTAQAILLMPAILVMIVIDVVAGLFDRPAKGDQRN